MERHELFASLNEKIHVTAAVIFFIGQNDVESPLHSANLTPNEGLRGFLYVGCSSNILHAFQIAVSLSSDAARYEVRTTLMTQKRFVRDGGERTSGGAGAASCHCVKFLHVVDKWATLELLVVVDGALEAFCCETLNNLGRFSHFSFCMGGITACCVAHAQGDASQNLQRLALLIEQRLVLVEYAEHGQACIIGGSAETEEMDPSNTSYIVVPEGTTSLAWHGDVIITGSSREYCLFDVRTFQMQQRMTVVDTLLKGPLCRYVKWDGDNSFILLRIGDHQLALFDVITDTNLESLVPVKLSEPVVDIAWAPPFLLGVKPDGSAVIRSWLEDECFFKDDESSSSSLFTFSTSLLPSFDSRDKLREMHSTPMGVYCICKYRVYFLVLMPPKTMKSICISAGLYEHAIRYFEHASGFTHDEGLQVIYDDCARHALKSKNFTKVFHFFELAATPTLELLKLVPELNRLSARCCNNSNNGDSVSERNITFTWSSSEAYCLLYDLLVRRRSSGLNNNTEELQVIEFAIFLLYVLDCVKCSDNELADFFLSASTLVPAECLHYIAENGICPKPALVPLVLARDGKIEDALARCKSQHLVREAAVVLQMSGDEQLYAKYFPWMLSADINSALLAVVSPQQHPPSSMLILPMLLGYGGYALHSYLHHLIFVEHNTDAHIHTLYATNLIDIIRTMQSFGVEGVKSKAVKLRGGNESGPRGAARQALQNFLRLSEHYDTCAVLSLLCECGLQEEQVLALALAGDHVGALTKLVYEMKDIAAAVQYCEMRHAQDLQRTCGNNNNNGNSLMECDDTRWTADKKELDASLTHSNEFLENLFLDGNGSLRFAGRALCESFGSSNFNEYLNLLLYVLLVPPAGKERLLSDAFVLLNEHSRHINPLSVLTSLPNEVCIAEISSYLLRAFQTLCNQVQLAEVSANAVTSMVSDAQRNCSLLHQRCVYIDEKRLCVACGKPLCTGVKAVFPNLKVAHFCCFRSQELDPERGVPFRPNI